MRLAKGFTLIELVVTIIVAGVLAAMAAPSFKNLVLDAKIGGQARALLSDLHTARSEAARLNQSVGVCPTANGTSCSTNWSHSRLVYIDDDGDNSRSSSESILKVSDDLSSGQTISGPGDGSVFFRSSGQINQPTSFKICDERVGNFGRLVTVSVTGRTDIVMTDCMPAEVDDDE